MGLEQLAAIRELLIKQSPDKAGSKNESRPQGTDKPRRPQGAGKGPRPQGGDKGQRAPRPEKRETPVDPVVVAISRLQRHFPKAFPKNPAPKLPLKLGVLADLVQHAEQLQLDEAQIKEAVKTWCDGRRYWASMVEDAPRVDLNGEPAGAVTANEARHAKRMASRNASRNAARARAEKKAQTAADQTPAPAADAAPDTQPADVPSADVKAVDVKAAEVKAAEVKAADTKAAGATSADVTPTDAAQTDVTPQASE
ncbi:RNA chaperone ProQ [Achromobacter animicus]|uniref:ProQ/FinO family protein n=1 Tax=Achromobacter animicus TaxID=1389935 RepID=UPI00146776F1|nr:ProQ/FINO family protein [Achromobacter animicus]CAB3868492.1 RNA chaperone ProQ [Achromobacter animicus]